MAFEFDFQINPDRICVQDTQTGYHLEASNRVVYRQRDGMVLALGEAEETVQAHLGDSYERDTSGVRSTVLFGADGAELPYEIRAMEDFTRLLHRQSQSARPMAHFLTKMVDGFDYCLSIPGYEAFPEARRNALEQRLQAHLRIRRLVINGQAVQIPLWRRNLEVLLRRILTLVLPLAAIVAGYLTMPAALATNPLPFLAYLLFIAYFSYYVGKILWMLLARKLVPADYRLCMFQGRRSRLSWIDRSLARALWVIQITGLTIF
jgi:hypothetical protein